MLQFHAGVFGCFLVCPAHSGGRRLTCPTHRPGPGSEAHGWPPMAFDASPARLPRPSVPHSVQHGSRDRSQHDAGRSPPPAVRGRGPSESTGWVSGHCSPSGHGSPRVTSVTSGTPRAPVPQSALQRVVTSTARPPALVRRGVRPTHCSRASFSDRPCPEHSSVPKLNR